MGICDFTRKNWDVAKKHMDLSIEHWDLVMVNEDFTNKSMGVMETEWGYDQRQMGSEAGSAPENCDSIRSCDLMGYSWGYHGITSHDFGFSESGTKSIDLFVMCPGMSLQFGRYTPVLDETI